MAEDQLEQQQLAAASAASADLLHDVPASTNCLHKREFSSPSREPASCPPTPQPPTVLLEVPHSAQSNVPHLPGQSELTERNRDREAALRRLNGQDPQPRRRSKAPESESIASTQPILVREYSQDSSTSGSPRQPKMRSTKRSSGYRSSEMPPLESFSFQDILASIDSDAHVSIEKIAEICGRSKMSMADEYSSHMPPQSDFSIPGLQEGSDHGAITRLDPVEEAPSTYEDTTANSRSTRSRVARLSLASSAPNHGDLLSAPVTATSIVASHTQTSPFPDDASSSENPGSYLPQLLVWLRASQAKDAQSPHVSRRDSGATNALQRILGGHTETTRH
ncbi:MAG: hypothetical protein Q9178_007831 [Gyalolechia marmorata]